MEKGQLFNKLSEEFEKLIRTKILSFDKLNQLLKNKNLFKGKNILKCIDEGTPGGVHLAGSGILVDDLKIINWKIIEGITFHDDCGAARLYIQHKNLQIETNKAAERFAIEISQKYNLPFLGKQPLKRPKEFHYALGIWISNLPNFDYSLNSFLPPGFTINPFISFSKEYTIKEINLALKIFQENGFYLIDKNIEFYLWLLNVQAKDFEPYIQTSLNLKILEFQL